MKYIKTKDTLASVEREEDIELFKRVGQKVANTIEELCDEFVLEKNDYFEYTIFKLFTTVKALKLESIKNKEVKANIYGAIWTDKGLIYVAKMNENGELELL